MNGQPWTDEEVKQLHELAEEKLTTRQIAARMGRTWQSIKKKVRTAKVNLQGKPGPVRRKCNNHTGFNGKLRKPLLSAPAQQHDPDAPEPRNLTLMELMDHTCKWPVTARPPHAFCGHAVEDLDGQPYCTYHRKRSVSHERAPRSVESEARRIAAVKKAQAKRGTAERAEAWAKARKKAGRAA